MAINRFVRVCKPQKYNKLFGKRASKVMISVVWSASCIVVTIVVMIGHPFTFVGFDPRKTVCTFLYKGDHIPSMMVSNAVLTIVLVLPLSVVVYCYSKVFKTIRQHKRRVGSTPDGQNGLGTTSVREIKITWVLFAVLLGYCLTWIPVVLVTLASNVAFPKHLPRQIHMVVTYSAASSNAINPMIYGVLNTAIRREYVKILKCQ